MSKTIDQLAAAATLDGTELVELEQTIAGTPTSVKATVDQIAARASTAAIGLLNGINEQTGTAYTLAATDVGKDVHITNAAAIALTLPQDSAVTIAVGAWGLFSQGGAGAVTATSDGTSVLKTPNGAATTAVEDARGWEKIAANTYRIY